METMYQDDDAVRQTNEADERFDDDDEELRVLALNREKYERDRISALYYAREEGRREGIARGVWERTVRMARKMLAMGLPVDLVVAATELGEDEVRALGAGGDGDDGSRAGEEQSLNHEGTKVHEG